MKKWAEFQKKQPIKEVKKFSEDIRDLGSNYKIDFLKEYGQNLRNYVDNLILKKYYRHLKNFLN